MKTRKYSRLPPEPGVPFTGFKFAEIQSRKPIARKIKEFIDYCIRDARSPAARIILGEWGEGKSEAYYRYIQPEVKKRDGLTYDVSAPSIIETYKNPTKKLKIKTNSATSVQFLTTIFWAISDELRAKGIVNDKIPSIHDFADPIEWLQEILHNHAGEKQLKLFIFIDQMEELLLELDTLIWFLTGLRETLDGKFFLISEKGPYPGSIFFFLSCTPDAYNRMRINPRIDQIWGGQQRRIDSIILHPIGKREGVKFFHDLLRYSYVNNLPHPLPFISAGVLNSLYAATRGNLGAMVKKFTQLMSSIPSENDRMNVIDGKYVTDWLSNESVSIYGGTTRCIEKELMNEIESALRKNRAPPLCLKLIKVMVGELKPFSVQEVTERFNLSISQVYRHINIINQALSNIVANSIIRVYPLKREFTLNDFIEKLKEFKWIDIDSSGEQIVHVDDYTEKVGNLLDKLTFTEFDEFGNLVSNEFLPFDVEAIQVFLEGISEENALKLRNIIGRLIDKNVRHFVISEAMINRLYPIPVSPWLQFIKNRDLRLRIWREVRTNFHKYFQDQMSDAFVNLLDYSTSIKVSNRRNCRIKGARYIDIFEVGGKVSIRTVIFSKSYINRNDITEIQKRIRGLSPRPNLVVILHLEELPEDAVKILDVDERLLPIKLDPTHAKNLLAINMAIDQYYEHVDRPQLEMTLKNLAMQMEIDKRILDWIDKGKRSGIVLTDLIKNVANNDKELVDALKFYINFITEKRTIEEIFNINYERLIKFVPFGLRLGFAADISKEQLKKITQDLKTNNFIIETPEGKIEVVLHPVEKRILEILSEKKEVDVKFLEEFFVLSAAARKILTNVYLSILKYKGLVKEIGNRIILVDLHEYQDEVERKYREYRDTIDRMLLIWKDYAHVYVLKKRAPRLILLKEFDRSVVSIFNSIQNMSKKEDKLQSLFLLESLIDHFKENIRPKIEGAVLKSKKIIEEVEGKFNEFKQRLSDLVSDYSSLTRIDLSLNNIREYSTICNEIEQIKNFYTTELTKEELLEHVETLDRGLFEFRNYRKDDYYFNIKLSKIESMVNSFLDDVKGKLTQINSMIEVITRIKNREMDLESKIVTFKLDERCLISTHLFNSLRHLFVLKKGVITREQEFKVKFPEIKRDLNRIDSNLVERESSISSAIGTIKEIHLVEVDYHNKSEEIEVRLNAFTNNVDVEKYQSLISELHEMLNNSQQQYNLLLRTLDQYKLERRSLRKLCKKLEKIIDMIDEIQSKMENFWKKYKKELEGRISSSFEVFSVLREHGSRVDETKLNNLAQNAKNLMDMAKKASPWIDQIKISKIEEELSKVIDGASELLQRYLTNEEVIVLNYIINERKTKGKDWITLKELIEVFEERKREINVEDVIQRLINKKILIRGVSFVSK